MLWRLALALVAVIALASPAHAKDLTLHFVDVGQGDGYLIETPAGKTVLVDAGPPDHVDRFLKRLKQLTARPLDLALLTHAHADHMAGMEKALVALGARVFLDAGFDHPSPIYTRLLEAIGRLKIPLKRAKTGMKIDLGDGVLLTILAPSLPFLEGTRSDANSNCIVARLVYGKTAFYLAGDAEKQTEQRVLASGLPLQSDLYKVAHHGSAHSSTPELLARMKPSVAIISVGADNEYGHPTREALQRLQAAGARVYRTDLDGEITVRSDGARITVTTGRPRALAGASSAEPTAAARPVARTTADKGVPAGGYLASRRSEVFHRAGCAGANDIKPANLNHYATRDAATADGRSPAKDCHP